MTSLYHIDAINSLALRSYEYIMMQLDPSAFISKVQVLESPYIEGGTRRGTLNTGG